MVMGAMILMMTIASWHFSRIGIDRTETTSLHRTSLMLIASATVIDAIGRMMDVQKWTVYPYGCLLTAACAAWMAAANKEYGGRMQSRTVTLASASSVMLIAIVFALVQLEKDPVDDSMTFAMVSASALVPIAFVWISSIHGCIHGKALTIRENYSMLAMCGSIPIACAIMQFASSAPLTALGVASCIAIHSPTVQKMHSRRHLRDGLLYDRPFTQRLLHKTFEDRRAGRIDGLFIGFGDMDRFGAIKHEYGNDVLDGVVIDIGNILPELMTRTFFVGSNGGDEFIFIMKTDDRGVAEDCIRQVYDAIARYDESVPYTVHMSIGLVEYTGQETAEDMLLAADRNASVAKERYYAENGFERRR